MTREESSNMSAGQDTEESNGQATSPVMVSAALGDHFAQVRVSIFAPPSSSPSPYLYPAISSPLHCRDKTTTTCRQHSSVNKTENSRWWTFGIQPYVCPFRHCLDLPFLYFYYSLILTSCMIFLADHLLGVGLDVLGPQRPGQV